MLIALAAGHGLANPGWAKDQKLMQISTLLDDDPATLIASRILQEAYQRLNHQLKVIKMPGERSLISANTGQTDGELYRKAGLGSVYTELLMVPVALMRYEIVAFGKTPGLKLPQGWESLRPYRFDFIKGIKIIEENTAGMQFETVATLRQAFIKLERERNELVLANRISGLAALRSLKLSGIHMATPALASFPVFHYLHKRHTEMVTGLTRVLQQLEQEKFIQQVQEDVIQHYDLPVEAGIKP